MIEVMTGIWMVVGLALVAWGWRGRRVGDHPHCRRCEFNLFGLSDDAPSCPECGHDLAQPRARVRGAKQRRKAPLVVGLISLAMACALGGVIAWRHVSPAALYAHTPSAYLLWVVDDEAARDELVQRLQSGTLERAAARRFADHALDVQGDHARPWDEAWGAIIEEVFAAGHLSDERVARYIRQALEPALELRVRPRVQRGRAPVGTVGHIDSNRRVGPDTAIEVLVTLQELVVDGEPTDFHRSLRDRAARFNFRDAQNHSGMASHLPLTAAGARLGQVPIEIEVGGTMSAMIAAHPVPDTIALSPQRLAAAVEVVDEPTGDYLRDEISLEDQARRAGVWIGPQQPGSTERRLVVAMIQQPVRTRVKTWLRVGGEVIALHAVRSQQGRSAEGHFARDIFTFERIFRRHAHLADTPRGDLIVRVDIEAAETWHPIPPAWLGEWVFEDVPLDAEPLADDLWLHNATELPTLVPARARRLTIEEAEQPPSAQRAEGR